MKLSLNWLKCFVAHGLSAEKLAHRLTMAGHEVKNIDTVEDDLVFEIEITPNRPDCLNTLGLAREVSAIVNKPLKSLKDKALKLPKAMCDVTIEDKAACLRYVGAVVKHIQIGAAPEFIKQKLQALGSRPVNNIVDITNYGLFENGQPLHAFDYDKLIGGKIVVRRAKAGEKIVTLDGVERELNPAILVIADAQRPVAIAGIMGGAATEVTDKTQRILLESAYFDPVLIRRAGRALGLTSDSAYRFERGVDLANVDRAAKVALGRIVELTGGAIVNYRDVCFKKTVVQKSFTINATQMSHFLGTKVSAMQIKKILKKLEFKVSGASDQMSVSAPSFRNDIKGAIDLSEEIARVIGYDRLPSSLPQIKPSAIAPSPQFQMKRKLRRLLTGQGFDEVISYPLISQGAIKKTKMENFSTSKIKNPLSLDQEYMRPSLLTSLLAVVGLNFNRGQKNLRLFELGKIYPADGEKEVLGVILSGQRLSSWQSNKKEAVDFYDLKGSVSRVFEALGFDLPGVISATEDIYSKEQNAQLCFGQQVIGSLGKINKDILRNWELKTDDVYFAQINLQVLYNIQPQVKRFAALSGFPSITRDVSIAVKQSVPFAQVEALAQAVGAKYLTNVHFLEQYLGEKIAAGQKGLVFSLVYQSSERTLTEAEIAPLHEAILQRLQQDLGAAIR
ncbi:MAG: phenylalanine--tRNA ligase subunit beta [Candidatus Omnitrophica bacterium]|nr:phenylalanine--tRNA ligase subunit beta [Candidatus Omnitrophota bacterium]